MTADFETGAQMLLRQTEPAELLRQLRALREDNERLQRWMQQIAARVSRLEGARLP